MFIVHYQSDFCLIAKRGVSHIRITRILGFTGCNCFIVYEQYRLWDDI